MSLDKIVVHGARAVSYTHLDVYKRQNIDSGKERALMELIDQSRSMKGILDSYPYPLSLIHI